MNWVNMELLVWSLIKIPEVGRISKTRLTNSGYSLSLTSDVPLHSVRMCCVCSHSAEQRRQLGESPLQMIEHCGSFLYHQSRTSSGTSSCKHPWCSLRCRQQDVGAQSSQEPEHLDIIFYNQSWPFLSVPSHGRLSPQSAQGFSTQSWTSLAAALAGEDQEDYTSCR